MWIVSISNGLDRKPERHQDEDEARIRRLHQNAVARGKSCCLAFREPSGHLKILDGVPDHLMASIERDLNDQIDEQRGEGR